MPRDRDDSLTGNLGRSKRRKMRNLRDTDLLTGAGGIGGGPVDPEDGGPGDGPGPAGPAGPGDCEGGLLGCAELAKGPFCSPDSAGAYEEQVGCVVDVATAQLSPGDTVAWAADLKLTSSTEVNPAGTLKMTDSGLLYRDALDTLDGVTIENGTAEILNGKLHLPDGTNNDVRFTGATTRNEVVAQIRVQGSMNPTNWILARFAARATASLDAYIGGYGKFQDVLDRYVGGVFDAQLDTESYAGGAQRLSGERTVIKLYTADGVQKLKMSTSLTDQTYQMSATDTSLDTDTGVPALISSSTNQPTIAWDLIECPNDEITCSSLPTGYAIRVGSLSATESAGTATLDLEGTLYPSSLPLEILDDNGDVVDAWMPSAGFFGGATFEYSSGGAFSPDDAAGQIDLDIFDASGTLLQTATTGSTWDQPTWKRFSGTVQLPEGSAFLAPTMRRTGTDTGVVCSRLIVVRKGTSAPWVPCEDDSGAAERLGRGPVILNHEFDGAAHWGIDPTFTDDGDASVTGTTYGNLEFNFSAGFSRIVVKQVASGIDDIDQDASDDNALRYYPVLPEDVITVVGFLEREDDTSPHDGEVFVTVDYWDADRNRIGAEMSTIILHWEDGTATNSYWGGDVNTGGEYQGRRQARFMVGNQHLQDDFTTLITEEQRQAIRYLTFTIDARAGASGTSSGFRYLQGWANDNALEVEGFLELVNLPTAANVGDIIRLDMSSNAPASFKSVFSLTRQLTFNEVDVDPDNLPGGTVIGDFMGQALDRYQQWHDWAFLPIPYGARIYAGVLAVSDPTPGIIPGAGYARRSSPLLRVSIDNTRQLVTGANQDSLPIASPPYRRTVHEGSDNSNSPDIDFAYGPRHEITLDANSTPAFHLTQPTGTAVYDTGDYDYTGTVWELVVKQDGTGGRTFGWPASNTVFAGGSSITVSSGADAEDRYRVECIDPDETTPVFLISVIAQNIS